ncbi:RNA-binding protein [Vaginisenegalia massiliensis]|uniref:YlmH family RNA-binding protein n=1 Tax=Vaginisenegalia massiliensis TaxID=2058294 RepID=UPI000F54A14A|nr:YlmH/Sll1252 family protein [Vaginisenegalia massiliensis]
MELNVYQHYRKEEQAFIDQVYGWLQQVDNRFTPYLSGFLTPRQAMIVQQLVNGHEDVEVAFEGGYPSCERKRALIYPSYYQVETDDYQVSALELKFPSKFGEMTHGRILGTLISTGIDRERIGDIITDGENWHILVDKNMTEFLKQQVTKVANVGVRLQDIPLDQVLTSSETWETISLVASSLRLDTLIAKVYNFSRQRAKDSVNSGLVKVNFTPMVRSDVEVGVNDIVSVRHHGRFWIHAVEGLTKKDNYRLTVNVLNK